MAGIYGFLHWFPMWATAFLLYFFCIGILFIIRDYFEKLPYNISVASQQGDPALIGCILIGVEIIKKQTVLAWWLDLPFQFILLGSSIIVGAVYQLLYSIKAILWKTVADSYHNVIVAPLLVFLLGATLPVVILYGSKIDTIFSALLFLIWAVTLSFDNETGRLQQQKWLAKHGIRLPLRRVK